MRDGGGTSVDVDLEAARECGLQIIYIERMQEESWPTGKIDGGDDSVGGLEVARNFEGEKKLLNPYSFFSFP